jgi:hypothetical protein
MGDPLTDFDLDVRRGLPAKRNFRAIDFEDPRIAAGRRPAHPNSPSWQESEFHQTPGDIFRKVQFADGGMITAP